jgi:hypothetical protein
MAATDPLGSGAARHQIARPHAGLHGGQPHRLLPDRLQLASSWPRRREGHRDPGRTRDPGISCGQPEGKGFNLLKNSRKLVFPFENPRKSILTTKIVKPLPENF